MKDKKGKGNKMLWLTWERLLLFSQTQLEINREMIYTICCISPLNSSVVQNAVKACGVQPWDVSRVYWALAQVF